MGGKREYFHDEIGAFTVSRRKGAKRITLSIGRSGTPNITIPNNLPIRAGQVFALKQRKWIEEHKPDALVLKPGALFILYDGTEVELQESSVRNSCSVNVSHLIIKLTDFKSKEGLRYFHKVINRHLADDSKSAVLPRLLKYQRIMSVSPSSVRFRATSSRWGSCSSQRILTFSSYIAQIPNELIDYVVIHELAHLTEMHHGKAFWALVASWDSDYKEHRNLLKQYKLEPLLKKVV